MHKAQGLPVARVVMRTQPELDIPSLVRRARHGDARAVAALVHRYQDAAFAIAMSRLRDRDDAADAIQEAFIQAIASLPSLEADGAFPQWLRAIVHHQCFRIIRRSRRRLSLDHAFDVPVTDNYPSGSAERNDEFERAMRAMHKLPDDQRELLSLRYLGELTQHEIAGFLGIPVSTVNTRLHAARKSLRRILLRPAAAAMREHVAAAGIAERVGELVAVRGSVLDARFAAASIPEVLSALAVGSHERVVEVTALVSQHLGDGLVRCIASSPSPQVRPGDIVVAAQAPASKGSERARTRAIGLMAREKRKSSRAAQRDVGPLELFETGIKVIDFLAPIARSSCVALIGEKKTGKLVLIEEIVHNLAMSGDGVSFCTFVPPDEVDTVQQYASDVRTRLEPSSGAEVLFVLSPNSDDSAAATDLLDTVIVLSAAVAQQGIYPAVAPLRCRSRWLTNEVAGITHCELVAAARELLARYPDSERAKRLRVFLSQPFFIAELHSQRKGRHVTRRETLRGCQEILSGRYDRTPIEQFAFVGSIDEVVE
jgi:RNA polymerase sigma factor (sigma-70 family)